jgi:16S rRNA (uracil1498-N3)-methyltransferase
MDLIVRQAAEGGITEIVPFASAFGSARLPLRGDDPPSLTRLERWRRIIREARQQSGSGIATTVHVPLDMDGLLAYWDSIKGGRPGSLGVLFHQDPLEQGSLHGYLGSRPELAAMAIGPEGGFSPAEAAIFLTAGFKPLKIGDTILRT